MALTDNLDEQVEGARGKAVEKAAAMERAQSIIKAAHEAGAVPITDEAPTNRRCFIAPIEKNTRFLVASGKVNQIRDPNSPTGMRDTFRSDEVWVEFHDGIAVFEPEQETEIAWCEANPAICRDIQDPMTEAWAFMKEAQTPLANRDAVLPQNMNVDAALVGRPGGVGHGAVQRAREHLKLSEK